MRDEKKSGPKVRPITVPAGTIWYGGPMDRCAASLRIRAMENADPAAITRLLGYEPRRIGAGKHLCWDLQLSSEESEIYDVEELVLEILKRLPADAELWAQLRRLSAVDVFCGLFMEAGTRGFGLKAATCEALAVRGLAIGFDVYAPD